MLESLKKDLENLKDLKKAKILQRFFKTGKGEYGEGDIFLGIPVPKQRKIAKKYSNITLSNIQSLFGSKIHEYRLVGLLVLIFKYKESSVKDKEKIFNFYLKNTKNINNWDLVDLSAPNIIGEYTYLKKDSRVLFTLAKSNNLWEKRIAMISTYAFIKKQEFNEAFKIAEILVYDKHDLIHKVVGWMLREIGKRNQDIEEEFLKKYAYNMPRTMLRYAIEKFDKKKRKYYLTYKKAWRKYFKINSIKEA